MSEMIKLGATVLGGGRCRFCVWAPQARRVDVHLLDPPERTVRLEPQPRGYHCGEAEAEPGERYCYRLDNDQEWPDPASRSQPDGSQGPSAVTSTDFGWSDAAWRPPALADCILYELHVGTFTAEGTFDAIAAHLGELRELGVNALEIMPIAQFSGGRNWGYDGVFPFAAQNTYGGPQGFKRLVDAGHGAGLAVILDVVYNHLGPEGNCFSRFGPYFTDRYKTPWGEAVNYDGAQSDAVRRTFIENALYWIEDCHVDGLRLDAVHAIYDHSAFPFLEELAATVHRRAGQLGRRVVLIAESDANDARLITRPEAGGLGYDAQWADDFHHALHVLLTGERDGYYEDYGTVEHLARAYRDGFVYHGQYSRYRQMRHGRSGRPLPGERFVFCTQNHDQVGNRMRGERLAALAGFEALKLAAGALLIAPAVPLLFMGEEYGEPAPFLYFTSHTASELVEAVRQGRSAEFAAFTRHGTPPDPASEQTFQRSKLDHTLRRGGRHRALREFYRAFIQLRRSLAALRSLDKDRLSAQTIPGTKVLLVQREAPEPALAAAGGMVLAVMNFADEQTTVQLPEGPWTCLLDSADTRWLGHGPPAPQELTATAGPVALNPWSILIYHRSQ